MRSLSILGQNGTTNAFASGFWYLDELGTLATMDHTVMCRQTLSGGNYELLSKGSFEPNPDYWTLVLWKRLMGTSALQVNVTGAQHLRSYGFCGLDSGVVLVVINLAQETTYEVSVEGIQGIFRVFSRVNKERS